MKTIKAVIIEWLKEIGADGLCCPESECKCSIKELGDCDALSINYCVPAKLTCCKDCQKDGNCEVQSVLFANGCYRVLEEE